MTVAVLVLDIETEWIGNGERIWVLAKVPGEIRVIGVTTAAERIIDAGDQVVVVASWHARGKASGVETDWRYAAVITLRDSKIVSLVSYPDPADALKAVGLEE